MKVLVTGGAGYIGSVVVDRLVQMGDSVVVYDNLSQGHRPAVHPQATFVQGDLADKDAVAGTMDEHRPEAIMHFASHTLVGESMQRPFLYLGQNVQNGLNLLESAVEYDVQRFILSSTANLFGEPERVPIDEGVSIKPGSPYGESKYILERILFWLDQLHGLRYGALRYFNASGALSPELGEDHDPETHLIPLVLQVALGQREKIIIFGDDYDTPDGSCIRDYIHVSDLAEAHILTLQALDQGSRTYNLGIGQGFSVKEIVDAAREITGHPIPAEIGPRRPGDPAELIAGSQRIKQELGWQPTYTSIRDIIQSAWDWHQANPRGFQNP